MILIVAYNFVRSAVNRFHICFFYEYPFFATVKPSKLSLFSRCAGSIFREHPENRNIMAGNWAHIVGSISLTRILNNKFGEINLAFLENTLNSALTAVIEEQNGVMMLKILVFLRIT